MANVKTKTFDSKDAYAVQTLARHQMIEKLQKDVLADMVICRIEGWDPYEYILMIDSEIHPLTEMANKHRKKVEK